MGFTKMCLELNTYFLYRRTKIPGLDRLSESYILVDNVIGVRDCLRVRIGKKFHASIIKKVFDVVEIFSDWSDGS